MPKLKTHKGTRKRVHITGRKRILRRQAGQDHFNSRESGRTTRRKRRDVSVDFVSLPATKKLIPYR